MTKQDLDSWAQVPFRDAGEVADAMSDPRYRDMFSGAYQRAVLAKLALGTVDGLDARARESTNGLVVHFGTSDLTDPLTGLPDVDASEREAAELDEVRRRMVEAHGPESVQAGEAFAVPQSYREALKTLKEQRGVDAVAPDFDSEGD